MSAYIGYNPSPTDDYTASFSDPSFSDQSVTIADIVLEDWEIPEKVSWGGAQRMTVHKMVGGTRYIDIMGQDNAEVSWSGRFLSPDASFRADQLDLIRKSGALIDVVFAGRYYSAVISSFTAQQVTQFHLTYSISFTILADESSVFPPPEPTVLLMVSADIATLVALAIVAPQLAAAQIAATLIPPLLLPLAALQIGAVATTAVVGAIGTTVALVNTAQAAAEGQVGAIADLALTTATLAGATTVVGAVEQMNAAASATFALASAVQMGAYANRAAMNVGNQ